MSMTKTIKIGSKSLSWEVLEVMDKKNIISVGFSWEYEVNGEKYRLDTNCDSVLTYIDNEPCWTTLDLMVLAGNLQAYKYSGRKWIDNNKDINVITNYIEFINEINNRYNAYSELKDYPKEANIYLVGKSIEYVKLHKLNNDANFYEGLENKMTKLTDKYLKRFLLNGINLKEYDFFNFYDMSTSTLNSLIVQGKIKKTGHELKRNIDVDYVLETIKTMLDCIEEPSFEKYLEERIARDSNLGQQTDYHIKKLYDTVENYKTGLLPITWSDMGALYDSIWQLHLYDDNYLDLWDKYPLAKLCVDNLYIKIYRAIAKKI